MTPTATAKPYSIHPRTCLDKVRQNTCYGGLRLLVNVATVLTVICSILGGLAWGLGVGEHLGGLMLGGIAAAVLSMTAIVARDALLLLVDIADTLIAEHARGPR